MLAQQRVKDAMHYRHNASKRRREVATAASARAATAAAVAAELADRQNRENTAETNREEAEFALLQRDQEIERLKLANETLLRATYRQN